ncbi:helix-turn-helix domain-containing protein [Tamaricihabitans halophyticus]|nr:helix-turn-helix domain-containing protein [Tamaricihabitans halophyticus]
MRPAEWARDGAAVWDIAVPSQRLRLPGVRMAGFAGNTTDVVDLPVVPHPAVALFIDLGDAMLVDDARGARERGSVIAGLAPEAVRGRGQHIECVQVRLSPEIAHRVLGTELSGTVVALDDVWPAQLPDRLRALDSWDDRFALVEAALTKRYAAGHSVDPEVAFVWQRMVARRGQVRIEQLADETGWSRKRLWTRFRRQIGLAPKRAAQLVRFDHAVHRLAADQSPASVAAESGYVDQAHLHHEVRAFAGVTPSAVAGAQWLAVDDVAWPRRGTG